MSGEQHEYEHEEPFIISISRSASDDHLKSVQEAFKPLNPQIEKNYVTKGIEDRVLTVFIDLTNFVGTSMLAGSLYDLIKQGLKVLSRTVKGRVQIILRYEVRLILYSSEKEEFSIISEEDENGSYNSDSLEDIIIKINENS